MTKAPERIWLNWDIKVWGTARTYKDDIKYYRADRYHACMDAGCSLHYHLFELTNALLNRPDISESEREMADMIDDAQLALDKWNRFLDGKEE